MYYYNQTFIDELPFDVHEWCVEHDAHIEECKEENQIFEEAEGKSITQKGKTYYTIKVNEYDGPTEGFHIGQVFHGIYPPEAAAWCDENNALIEDTGNHTYVINEVPEPTLDEKKQSIRNERDKRLEATYGIAERHRSQKDAGISTTLTEDEYHQLGIYQQNLRDIPQHKDFPWNGDIDQVPWPIKPSFIK